MNRTDFACMLATLTVPALLPGSERLHSARRTLVPGGSHFAMWDAPEPFFEAIRRFVETREERR